MNILVIGGTRLLGLSLVKQLLVTDNNVTDYLVILKTAHLVLSVLEQNGKRA